MAIPKFDPKELEIVGEIPATPFSPVMKIFNCPFQSSLLIIPPDQYTGIPKYRFENTILLDIAEHSANY